MDKNEKKIKATKMKFFVTNVRIMNFESVDN